MRVPRRVHAGAADLSGDTRLEALGHPDQQARRLDQAWSTSGPAAR